MIFNWLKLKKYRNEQGIALALVLIATFILGMWVVSVAFLTQSSGVTLQTNIKNSEYRARIVSDGIGQALAALTSQESPGNYKRYGIHPLFASPISQPCEALPNGGVITSQINPNVKIQCTESKDSGNTKSIASYVLTGTDCMSSSCIVGQDVGLTIKNASSSNTCTTTPDPSNSPILISGGIFNSSGAWNGVDCGTMFLSGTGSKITQPDASDASCPAKVLNFTAGSGKQNCTCPVVSASSTDPNKCFSNIAFSSINPKGVNEFRGFLDSEAAKLSPVLNNPATYTGSCTSNPAAPVYWSPGILGQSEIQTLNTQTGTSGSACDASHPIIFRSGVYRFSPVVGTGGNCTSTNTSGCVWQLLSGASVVGGTPNSDYSNCLNDDSGVQFQFNYPFGILAKSGTLSLCNSSAAVISAPMPGAPTDFSWSGDWLQNPVLAVPTANGKVQLNLNGMVYAPAAFADLALNATATVLFNQGAIFRAMTLTETGSFKSSTSIAPPPPFNGDRVVQLRFYDTRAVTGSQADLGMIQFVIRDYYGRRYASGYQILSWRAAW